ncbi:MAG: hypothetical protein ACJAQT_003661 [Akkermansiaceae bacterium]|jgi:hypothetical protein
MKLILLLSLLGIVTTLASPIWLADLGTRSPWVAHIDTTKLRTSPLRNFLAETAGFDQFLQLKGSLKDKLSLDVETIEGLTLLGSGKKWRETSILIRGDFALNHFDSLPVVDDKSGSENLLIRQVPELDKRTFFLTKYSGKELVVGTSVQAVRDGVGTLREPAPNSWATADLTDDTRAKLGSAIALFAIDMKTIGAELKFEAELTRAMRSAWLLINSRGNDIEVSFLINSPDSEGLTFLSEKWTFFSTMLVAGQETPQAVRESMAAQKVTMHGQWMTVTMAAPPKEAAQFLKAFGPLFGQEPKKTTSPE